MLAHVERYLPDQPRALWPKLRRMGILFQCNASFFLDWRTKHRAVKMLRNREIDILGSDCHGVSYRPPRLDEARSSFAGMQGMKLCRGWRTVPGSL